MYISFAPKIIRELKNKAINPNMRELIESNKLILFFDNFAVIKSTITLPSLRWHNGKKEPIATAQAISTNSKSPKIGDENTTLPKIEKILIKAAVKSIKPPKIAKYLEIKFKIRPNLLFGRIDVKIFFPKLMFRTITSFFHILKLKILQYRKVFDHQDLCY